MNTMRRRSDRSKSHGQAAIELALMSPWILLLFMAVFDFGFYMVAAMSVSNAARAAALATASTPASAASQALACRIATSEMNWLPNASSFVNGCASGPLVVTAAAVAAVDDNTRTATRVRVTYQTIQLFPLPFLMGRMNLTRQAEMRVYGF